MELRPESTAANAVVSVAPMMGYSDRHARYLFRLISPHCLLYTEMMAAQALLHENASRLLEHQVVEYPVALQLGGSEPGLMAEAAYIGAAAGFDEININVGCPSDRVQSGTFGACLMAIPELVAEIYDAMQQAIDIPVTVKHRIGIDEQDSYQDLEKFIDIIAGAGCRTFIVHARKAWLKGLSPKQNRDVPPLDYERVYRLKSDHPELNIVINGGITTVSQAVAQLAHVDGVMIGREAFKQPWLLSELESRLYPDRSRISHHQVLQSYAEYMEVELAKGTSVHMLVRPLAGMFHGCPGARHWRRLLAEVAQSGDPGQWADLPNLVAGFAAEDSMT